ncbi:MAG: energy-coupled thiamine transporter ThiT [Oscillospiraceae bacterium]
MQNNQNVKVFRLVESGLLIALGIILDTFFRFEAPWAYGGSITLFSMLPLVIIAYKYGVLWGSLGGIAHGLITMLISGFRAGGLAVMVQDNGGWKIFIFIMLLDYILAFMAIGLAGFAPKFMKSTAGALGVGAAIGLFGRYIVHVVSGYIFFGSYAEWFFGQSTWGQAILEKLNGNLLSIVYSTIYNGLYMIPEIILTAAAGVVVGKFLKKQINHNKPNLTTGESVK